MTRCYQHSDGRRLIVSSYRDGAPPQIQKANGEWIDFDTTDPASPYHGFEYLPDGFPPEPGPSLDEVKSEAVKAVKQRHAETLNALTGGETIEERDTWAPKAKAAERYLSVSPEAIERNDEGAAKDAEFLMIETEALFGEDDPTLFAETIKEKAEEYARLIGLAGGIKRKALKAIHAAETAEDVAAILEASEAEAVAALTKWLSAA
ncbi:hypothetical protein TRICHSKD4_2542 [Roseibium sp. TrichSKD4]|uniref:hypothetical protein n=1 Tax=Roseibium sp. TrichSKD4 TaxID=744980 RepID=UPI0001E56D56|nr:hypothetical protein [Roseibium sp. TrichSKD4]EFO32135.1 hypothetical protein TRICHSKD4_2542 [Roseibium sp. TrichSKD4]